MTRREYHNGYMRAYNKKDPERARLALRKYTYKRRGLILDLKNKTCADCRGWFNPWQMHFDHRDRTTKKFNLGGAWTKSAADIVTEAAKCDVVCANCHADRTYKAWGGRYDKTDTGERI